MESTDDLIVYGNREANIALLQVTGAHELDHLEKEYELIRKTSSADFRLTCLRVDDWNKNLSPWEAPAVFGKENFGGGANDTLNMITESVLPRILVGRASNEVKLYIGGYSLAGLFALWSVYQTDAFAGCAAASPSVWFPKFTDYIKTHDIRTNKVYLSLGDAEEKTKNTVMKTVGQSIRDIGEDLKTKTECVLEWNRGGHFKDTEMRLAKGFTWLLNNGGSVLSNGK